MIINDNIFIAQYTKQDMAKSKISSEKKQEYLKDFYLRQLSDSSRGSQAIFWQLFLMAGAVIAFTYSNNLLSLKSLETFAIVIIILIFYSKINYEAYTDDVYDVIAEAILKGDFRLIKDISFSWLDTISYVFTRRLKKKYGL